MASSQTLGLKLFFNCVSARDVDTERHAARPRAENRRPSRLIGGRRGGGARARNTDIHISRARLILESRSPMFLFVIILFFSDTPRRLRPGDA